MAAHAGDYADAIKKGSHVKLLLVETTGAFSLGLDLMLRALGAGIKASDAQDTTAYGLNKTSPRTFYAHHSAAITAAAAAHESLILESAATGLSSALLAIP